MTADELRTAIDELTRQLAFLMAGIDPATGDGLFPGDRPEPGPPDDPGPP